MAAYPVCDATWPAAGRHPASKIADRYNEEITEAVTASVASGQGRPKLVGLLANEDPAGEVYARMTQRACDKVGIEYELRKPSRLNLEEAVISANADPTVHGIIVYYPVFGGGADQYLRDVISVEKDVEGLSHQYCYSLYHNIRYLEADKKCVLPCTPLACVKVLENLGAYSLNEPVGRQLAGKTAVIYNRSEVVGRPLAAMLANDGAQVYSVDENGVLLMRQGAVAGVIKVEETNVEPSAALANADIVIGGVPSKNFQIAATEIKKGAICINVAQHMNFGEGTDERCAVVPAVGKVTIAILARNLLRLHANFHAPKKPPPLLTTKDLNLRTAALVLGTAAVAYMLGLRSARSAA